MSARIEALMRSMMSPESGPGDGSRPLTAGEVTGLQEPPDVRRLTDVLQVVVRDADEPDAERHGRVPVLVDHPVEVGVRERAEEVRGALRDGVVVGDQGLPALRPQPRHLLSGPAVARLGGRRVITKPP